MEALDHCLSERLHCTCRFFPDFDLSLAPKLFAALFPDSCFSLELRYEYSVGGGEKVFYADYRNNILLVRECQTEEDLEKLDEDLREQFEEGELSIEELEDALLEVNGARQINPSRNAKYENSFFFDGKAGDLGDDLLAYLAEE